MKHYKLVEFLSKLNVKSPLHERKATLHKRKTPQLTTFRRRFGLYDETKVAVWLRLPTHGRRCGFTDNKQ